MKDCYPVLNTLPADHLVAPESQPEYLEPPSAASVSPLANVGVYLSDRQVELGRGERIAMIDAGTGAACTFSQLAERGERIAAALRRLGVRPGDRIAYRAPNVSAVIALMVGIWKAGAVVVPIPLQATAEDLRFYLLDTGARFLFSHASAGAPTQLLKACAGTALEQLIGFDAYDTRSPPEPGVVYLGDLLPEGRPSPAPMPLLPNSIAILWHTGGTTGTPKGCYHTHRRFLLGGYALATQTAASSGERWTAAAPIGHALGIIHNTIYTLLHGVCIVLLENFSDPFELLRAVATYEIDTLTALAPTWAKMLHALETDNTLPQPRFKRAYAMWQSASSSEIYDRWRRRNVELLNNFGSTSFATWVLAPVYGTESPPAALGRPLPGYEVEAVDTSGASMRILPRGEIGQMAVRGPTGLTYWNRPHYQKRDVVGGWTLQDDLIRYDAEGNVHYLGRTDYMISTGGYKVAPAEVENALSAHGAVQEVAVVPGPCPTNFQMVVAYVVLRAGIAPSASLVGELREFVKGRLSSYKAPRRIEFVVGLPRDAVGKVQSKIVKQWAYESATNVAAAALPGPS